MMVSAPVDVPAPVATGSTLLVAGGHPAGTAVVEAEEIDMVVAGRGYQELPTTCSR
jgi:hypothetical protein